MREKILITGGTGFIGSHLAELLVQKNFKVTVFDRYNPIYSLGNLKDSKFKKKSILSLVTYETMTLLIKQLKIMIK